MSLNTDALAAELYNIEETFPDTKSVAAEKYMLQAEVGHMVADFIISKATSKKEMKEARKQLKDASKQLKSLRKDIKESIAQLGYETAPKHLWSVIQLIQQAQHMYTASGSTKHDAAIFDMVPYYIRQVPSVWEIANTIDGIAEQKRKVSGKIVNQKA